MTAHGNAVCQARRDVPQDLIERMVLADWARQSLEHPEWGLKNPEIIQGITLGSTQVWGWYEEVDDDHP